MQLSTKYGPYADYGRASALSVILIISTVVPLFLVNKTILKQGTLM
jgi:ABC-type Fe3+ transport system permease subunit